MRAAITGKHMISMLAHMRHRAQWVPLYTTAVSVIGLAIALITLSGPKSDVTGLVLFAVMASLADLLKVELFVTSRESTVSVASAITVASIAVFGPLGGVFTCTLMGLVQAIGLGLRHEPARPGQAPWLQRSAFNAGMDIIAAALAGWAYVAAGGTPGNLGHVSNVLPLVAAAIIYVVANIAILIGVLTLQTGYGARTIWKQDFQWAAPISILGNVLGGGILALAYGVLGTVGAMAFLLPILATGYSFQIYANNVRPYVRKLEEMNRSLADANRSLDEANLGLLKALGTVIDAYDAYTYGHSRQVADYARAIAQKIDLSEEHRALVERAALIHDIGKIGVTDSIMDKSEQLTDQEYSLIKRHPSIGAEIVAQVSGLHDLVPMVKHHHERWDGRGYPDRLSGSAIPLGARIIALADTLDAMCSDRSYRRRQNFGEVIAEVKRCSGAQFDPSVVDAFLLVATEKGPEFFQNSATAVDNMATVSGLHLANQAKRQLKKSMLMPEPGNN